MKNKKLLHEFHALIARIIEIPHSLVRKTATTHKSKRAKSKKQHLKS